MAVSIDEYLRRGSEDPALRGRDTDSIRSALQAISSYQRNVDVGSALGIESTGKREGGVLRRFMENLERPALAIRAGGLKALGYDDPQLRRYENPFQAAAGGFRRDVRITGGDIIRTDRDDNPLQRAAKLAGAFAIDVATDPITYVGTPAALGRKTASELAFRQGGAALNTAAQATAKATGRATTEMSQELITKSFNSSDVGQLLSFKDPGTVRYVEELAETAGRKAVGTGADLSNPAVRKAYEEAGEAAVDAWKSSIAADQFGNAIATSLYMGGRRGLRADLTDFLGSREAAEQVFLSLPDRVRGGLYFTNPLTGQRIARLTEGTGDMLGPIADYANKMRIYTAATVGKGTQLISGQRGRAWQKVRLSAAQAAKRGDSPFGDLFGYHQSTIREFVREKEMTRLAANEANKIIKEARFVSGQVAAFRPRDPQLAAQFDDLLGRAYYGQAPPDLPAGSDIGKLADEAVGLGNEINAVIRRARDKMVDAGVLVGDAGPNYKPLMFGDEAAAAYNAQREMAGILRPSRAGAAAPTNPTISRDFGQVVIDNPEAAAQVGWDFFDDLVRLNPAEANRYMYARQLTDLAAGDEKIIAKIRTYMNSLDELPAVVDQKYWDDNLQSIFGGRTATVRENIRPRMFEEDPIKLMAKYAASAGSRTESATLLKLGFDFGLITRASADTVTALSGTGAPFASGIKAVNEAVFKAVSANPKLARLVSGGMSEEELMSLGMVAPRRMAELIDNLQVNQVVPDNAIAAKEFEEIVTQWFRLSALRESGQNLTRQQSGQLDSLTQALGRTSQMFSDADDAFRALDSTYSRLTTQYNLTPEEARELVSTVSTAIDGQDVALSRLPNVSKDLEEFLLASGKMSTASEARINELVQNFFETRQIASEVDQAAAAMGLRIIGTGDVQGAVNVPPAMRMLRARAGMKELLEKRAQVAQNPDEIKKFFNEVYDPMFQVWKAGATSLRGPGYTFLNMVGNLWHSYLGDVSVAAHGTSARVLSSVRQAYRQAGEEVVGRGGQRLRPLEARATLGKRADQILAKELSEEVAHNKTLFEVFEDFIAAGGADSSQMKDVLDTAGASGLRTTPEQLRRGRYGTGGFEETARARKVRGVADSFLNNQFSGTVNSLNTDVETWTRFAAYLDTFVETGSIDAAMDRVFLLHFNYGDLSNWDMALRRIFPFYVWSRNNIPAQARALFMQPAKIRRLLAAQEGMKSQLVASEEESWLQEVLPDYIHEVEGYATRLKSGPHNIAIASKLPFDDVDRIFQLGGAFGLRINSREIYQSFGPQLTFPLEMAFQRDFSTGGAFDPLGREATGWRAPLGYVPGIGRVGPRGERRVSQGVDKVIGDLLPYVQTAERTLSGASAAAEMAAGGETALSRALAAPTPEFMRDRGMSNLLNVTGISPLFGVSATTLAPTTISSSLRERRRRQLADIGQAAGRQGVSVDWVRQQLNAGRTPEEIALLIQQGEGRIDEWEAEQAERMSGPDSGLQDLLRNLGR